MSHEPQNLHARGIAWSGVAIGVSACLVMAICFVLWKDWAASEPQPARFPAAPRLQATPASDLDAYRQAQARRDGWGWVDREHRIARVPVDRAMQLMAREPKR
ncbi:MAG: hypothetical protein ABWZ85_04480 [Luteibacter sp.]